MENYEFCDGDGATEVCLIACNVCGQLECAGPNGNGDPDPIDSTGATCEELVSYYQETCENLVAGNSGWFWPPQAACGTYCGVCFTDCDAGDIVALAGGALGSCPLEGLLEHGGRCSTTCPSDAGRLPFGCDNGTVTSASECCAIGTMWDGVHGSSCTPCVAGTYDDDSDSSTSCTPCVAGTYSDVAGATECVLVCLVRQHVKRAKRDKLQTLRAHAQLVASLAVRERVPTLTTLRVSHARARSTASLVNAKSALHRTSSMRIVEHVPHVHLANNRAMIEQRACRAVEIRWRPLVFVKDAQAAR